MGTKLKITLTILGLLIFGYLVVSVIYLQKEETQISASQAELIKPGLLPNLSLSITDGVEKVKPGDKVTYEIKLANQGATENTLKIIGFIASPTEISPLYPDLKSLLEQCAGSQITIGLRKPECAPLFNHPSLTEALSTISQNIGVKRPTVSYFLKMPSFTWLMDKFLTNAEMTKKIPVTIPETQSPTIVTTVYVYQKWPEVRMKGWPWFWGIGNWRTVAVARDINMVER
jgi:hypothetical protein